MAGKKLYFSGLLNFDPPETISGRFKNETVPPWGSKTTSKKKIICIFHPNNMKKFKNMHT